MIQLSNKAAVLGQLWLLYRDDAAQDPVWNDYFIRMDVALPLAYMLWTGYVTNPSGEAMGFVDEAWEEFCGLIEIDAEGEYADIVAAFAASSHEAIK